VGKQSLGINIIAFLDLTYFMLAEYCKYDESKKQNSAKEYQNE